MLPLISVIIPTYNYAQFITDAINSVLQQDYPKDKIDIIVVDDGSADNTKEVLSKLIKDKTIKYYYQQNKGKASATYKAIQYAAGKYIFNLDADDYFLAGKIKQTVAVFENDESIVHVATPAKQINTNNSFRIEPVPNNLIGKVLNGSMLLKLFVNENMLYGGGSTYAARTSVLKQILIPEAVDMYIDEFLVLAILPFGNSYFINEHLSVWRGHGTNYSTKETDAARSKRLLHSSNAILTYLQQQNFDKKIVDIYKLKDLTRNISHKESLRHKTFTDIAGYAAQVLKIKPAWSVMKKYHVLNRLIPTPVFNFLKQAFTKSSNNALGQHGA